MPFDPTQPADLSPLSSAAMRAQLNALNDKIPASAVVESVTTGSGFFASATLNGTELRFSFILMPGPPGPPGEVTTAQLNDALAVTGSQTINIMTAASSANTNGVLTFDTPSPATYDPMFQQALINKLNELITALHR